MNKTILIVIGLACVGISLITCQGCLSYWLTEASREERQSGFFFPAASTTNPIFPITATAGDLVIGQQLADRSETYSRNNTKGRVIAIDLIIACGIQLIFFNEPPEPKNWDDHGFGRRPIIPLDEINKIPEFTRYELAVRALTALRQLNDKDPLIRRSAVVELSKLDAKAAIPEIKKLLKDENKDVRDAAESALRKLGVSEAEIEQAKQEAK